MIQQLLSRYQAVNLLQLFAQNDTLNIVVKIINKKSISPKGFTLIELILYMGILLLLIGILSSIFTSIVDVQLESTAKSSVDQDGRYLLSKLLYDVRSASSITSPPNPGDTASTMQITSNSIIYTYSLNSSNNLQVVNGSTSETIILNGYDTSVSGLTFTRIGSGDSNDTLRVSYMLTSRTKERSGQETKSFQTTVGKQ